jgi:hypothetical protein
MRSLRTAIVIALAAGFFSCGDSGGGDEVAASASDVDSLCQALCDHDVRCRGSNEPDCLASCKARLGNTANLSRQACDILAACARDPACLDDDTCEERALRRDPSIVPLVDQCLAFARSCPMEMDLSYCLRAGMMIPTVRAQIKSCMVGECTSEKSSTCFAF